MPIDSFDLKRNEKKSYAIDRDARAELIDQTGVPVRIRVTTNGKLLTEFTQLGDSANLKAGDTVWFDYITGVDGVVRIKLTAVGGGGMV